MADTNPNGANQYKLDPRQALCWSLYINPESDSFGNAYASAIKAGYEEDSARNITLVEWFKESQGRLNRIKRAETVLDETLKLNDIDETGKVDAGIVRAKTDVAKFILEKTSKHYQPKKELDVTSKGEAVTGFNYILPKE